MTADPTTAYFDDVVMRALDARPIPREQWPEASPHCCHQNCESFVQRFPEYHVGRGWLVNAISGGHWLIPHSVIRDIQSGRLADITLDPSAGPIRFVEHIGTEDNFTELRKGRDGGWLHPQPNGILHTPLSDTPPNGPQDRNL